MNVYLHVFVLQNYFNWSIILQMQHACNAVDHLLIA